MKRNVIKIYTDFIFKEDVPEKADIIFIPGSEEGALARKAAGLWKEGLAPVILPSGKYAKLTGHLKTYTEYPTEWAYLQAELLKNGVPSSAVWREDKATFTYENALFSRKITDEAGLRVKKAILCCQAYHAGRALLYYQICFPETEFFVCPVETKGITRDNWYLTEEGRRLVLTEVKHCGSQFVEALSDFVKRNEMQNLETK